MIRCYTLVPAISVVLVFATLPPVSALQGQAPRQVNNNLNFGDGMIVVNGKVVSGAQANNNAVRGSGRIKTGERVASGFHAIDAAGAAQVVLIQGGTEGVRIEAEDNLLPLLEARVVDGTLRLGPRQGVSLSPTRDIRFTVRLRRLDSLDCSGSVAAMTKRLEVPGDLRVSLSGSSGLIVAGMRVRGSLTADVNRASEMDVAGTAPAQRVTLSGASEYRAAGLITRETFLKASGASKARVRATGNLRITATGASDVQYAGGARVTQHTSGASTVEPIPAR